jgi:hypothetical protein
VSINVVDLQGAKQELTVRVCEAGPFLAMNFRGFAWRLAPKDAFDILYTLLHYENRFLALHDAAACWSAPSERPSLLCACSRAKFQLC